MKTSKEDREQMRVKVEHGWPNEPTLLVHRSLFRNLLDDLDEAEKEVAGLTTKLSEADNDCRVLGSAWRQEEAKARKAEEENRQLQDETKQLRQFLRNANEMQKEAEARINRLEGDLICDVCGGKPPESGLPCICGGSGVITDASLNLRTEIYDQRREHDMAIAERNSIQKAHDRLYANLQRWKAAVKRYGEFQYVLACLEERYPIEDYPEPPDNVVHLRLVINKAHTAFRAGDIDSVEEALKTIPEDVKP